jgi:hypothetical protein
MTKLEERIRSGLHETAERIPDTGIKLRETKSKPVRPAWVGVAAVLGVLVLFSPTFLLDGTDPAATPQGPETPSAAAPDPSAPEPEPDYLERFPVVIEVEETGDLIGLQRGHALKSSDGGASWTEIVVDGGADLIDVAPDGTVIAVGNAKESTDALGPDSSVRPAPKVHLYDAAADSWQTLELPRPEFPVDNPQPAPMDGSGDCPKGNIQWTMDALSLAIGDRYVIAGEQRITEATICDQSYQLFWTSQDGEDWAVTEPTGIPGYMVGLTWFDGTYIAYGSDTPWYSVDPDKSFEIWTSTDLANWESNEIDLAVLPSNGYPSMFPNEEASFGTGMTVQSTVTDGVLRLNIPIGLAAPGPEANVADIEELNRWAETNNRTPINEDTLVLLDIDFPLDEEEAEKLSGYFHSDEGYGSLTLETDDGVTWTSQYEDR